MEVVNDLVGYDNLRIYQNDDWFKFSLESILLPFFATVNLNCRNILDLCTGNAPVPLILSTKTKAKIYGVELQKDIYLLAQKTIDINNLNQQITIINDDVKNLACRFESDYFDLITVNPPYFQKELTFQNKDIHKTLARHEVNLSLEDIIKISRKLLKNNGRLVMVHRTERFLEIIRQLENSNLMPKKVQFIYPKEDQNSKLFLIEAVKNGKAGLTMLSPLIVHNDDGTYRQEIKRIFQKEDK